MPTIKQAKAITITFLSPVSLGSLNGSDKEADNLSSIKKLTRGAKTFPYVSSQALRRALRDQLEVLGHTMSQGKKGEKEKGAAITQCKPAEFIDDDLFGFMDARKETFKRTSPVRVSPLLALDPFEGDIDFGTNYMSVDTGGNPNIFETEIHGGLYRGTVLIELDAVGRSREGEGVSAEKPREPWDLEPAEKAVRVKALLKAAATPVVERAPIAVPRGHQSEVRRGSRPDSQGTRLLGVLAPRRLEPRRRHRCQGVVREP